MTQSPRSAHIADLDRVSGRAVSTRNVSGRTVSDGRTVGTAVAVDVTDPDLDADVRAVLAALALDPGPRDGASADVVVTDRPDPGVGSGGARVVRVGAEGAGGDDDEVIRLPSGTADLVGALMAPVATGRGSLVAVVGAVGGCGASTLAAAIAVRAADSGRALLVEADPLGTGIDLVLGIESEPGLRVEDVRAELGGPDPDALWGAAPAADPGCKVLARARDREVGEPASDGALGAALAHRSAGGLVVCDAGRFADGDPVLARADLVVVVTRADLQGAVAAGRPGGDLRGATLVIRTQRGDPLDAADVADSAGIPRWHVLPEVRAVRHLAGTGDLGRALGLGRGGRGGRGGRVRRLGAVADALLGEVSTGEW
ncbi:chromosome partitioning protein [Dietzia psychralcaliphila]|uniref:chromosome partitioning protein n=1 Tax=Dietzia psychralcaliphila TaxID=139021 RepID=UPI001FCF8B07|nr:chromosome partitioning protein [Dietzia psychralcaliphila]